MAKLSARNRTCQVEVTREYTEQQLQTATDRMTARLYPEETHVPYGKTEAEPVPESMRQSLTVWEKRTRRLMSDGTILEKLDVRFRPSPNCSWEDPKGRRHSYGWKVHGKLKAGVTADDFARVYSSPRKDGSPSSWTVTTGAVAPAVLISERRIVAAVKRDDGTGFCTACGNEQDGCEPDAEGYTCQACGQPAVSGAEQLLMGVA